VTLSRRVDTLLSTTDHSLSLAALSATDAVYQGQTYYSPAVTGDIALLHATVQAFPNADEIRCVRCSDWLAVVGPLAARRWHYLEAEGGHFRIRWPHCDDIQDKAKHLLNINPLVTV